MPAHAFSQNGVRVGIPSVLVMDDCPKVQDDVAQKMVDLHNLHKETPGPMTPASTAKLREKYDAECRVLLKAAWCEAYKDPGACRA